MENTMYWYPNTLLTYNALIYVIVGNRGGGKTFGFKELSINDFINDNKMIEDANGNKYRQQFAYVRRYEDDLKKSIPTFFKDIAWKYPDYEFKVEGEKFYMRLKVEDDQKVKWTDEDIIGYGFKLSTANNLKSVAYPYVTKICMDEFLLDPKGNQRYLNNEVSALLNLYETIARPGTDHPKVTLWLLANAISVTNPYFLYWRLSMPKTQNKQGRWIWRHKTKPIIVEDVRKESFIDKKKNSEFGKLVEGTKYGDYSIDNKFYLDDDTFIEKKSSIARYYFTFTYKDNKYGVWADFNEGKMWVSKDIDPSYLFNYALTLKDHKPNTLLINTRGKKGHFKVFTDAFKSGTLYFESMDIKNLTYEVIKMIMN